MGSFLWHFPYKVSASRHLPCHCLFWSVTTSVITVEKEFNWIEFWVPLLFTFDGQPPTKDSWVGVKSYELERKVVDEETIGEMGLLATNNMELQEWSFPQTSLRGSVMELFRLLRSVQCFIFFSIWFILDKAAMVGPYSVVSKTKVRSYSGKVPCM